MNHFNHFRIGFGWTITNQREGDLLIENGIFLFTLDEIGFEWYMIIIVGLRAFILLLCEIESIEVRDPKDSNNIRSKLN